MTGRSYGSYLKLGELLAAPEPTTPREHTEVWLSERFFIVCHQTSELWVSQVLADLGHAGELAERGEFAAASEVVLRARSIVELLCRHLVQLTHLDKEHFLTFRPALDGASGAESEQFNELLRGRENDRVRRLEAAAALAADDQAAPATEAVQAFLDAVSAWRWLHVRVARQFNGRNRGTGGTTGVDYLLDRISKERRFV